jgi:hypothetical protein
MLSYNLFYFGPMRSYALFGLALVASALFCVETANAAPLSDWQVGQVLNFGGKILTIYAL